MRLTSYSSATGSSCRHGPEHVMPTDAQQPHSFRDIILSYQSRLKLRPTG